MPTRTNKQMYCSFNFTKVNPKLFSSLHLSLNKIAFHFHTRRGAAPLCVESASSSTKVLNRDYGICAFLVQNFVTRIPRIWFRYEFIAQLKLLLCYCFSCSFCLYYTPFLLVIECFIDHPDFDVVSNATWALVFWSRAETWLEK